MSSVVACVCCGMRVRTCMRASGEVQHVIRRSRQCDMFRYLTFMWSLSFELSLAFSCPTILHVSVGP